MKFIVRYWVYVSLFQPSVMVVETESLRLRLQTNAVVAEIEINHVAEEMANGIFQSEAIGSFPAYDPKRFSQNLRRALTPSI